MSLLDWTPSAQSHHLEESVIVQQVRCVLAARQVRECVRIHEASVAECRTWVKRFIAKYVPRWRPGLKMSSKEEQVLGHYFDSAVRRASQQLARARLQGTADIPAFLLRVRPRRQRVT
jgi:hypothetical protein